MMFTCGFPASTRLCSVPRRRHQIDKPIPLPLNPLPRDNVDWYVEHRPGIAEGVKLTAFAAGIDGRRQVGQQPLIEAPADELRVELLRIHAGQRRPEPRRDHRPGEAGSVRPPERKSRLDAGGGQLPFAVAANVGKVEVAEGKDSDVLCPRTVENAPHPLLVRLVGARPGQRDLPERKLGRCRLGVDQLLPYAVHRDPPDCLVERRDESNNVDVAPLPEHV